jgi:ATP-dependent Clp protease ATP-binding subunit ClpA
VIFLTSNLGSGEITELMQGGMGFVQPPKDKAAETGLDEKVQRTAVEAARRKFSPEFMNRLDKVVVFHPLQRLQLEEVLNIELGQVQQRVLETAKGQFLFRVTDAGRDFLLREGTDQRYGARHLKRAIERHVVYPLANLLATEQVHLGDLVRIDWDGVHNALTFVRESEGALVPSEGDAAETKAAAVDLKDGKTVETPSEAVAETKKKPVTALPAAAQAPAAAPQAKKRPEKS